MTFARTVVSLGSTRGHRHQPSRRAHSVRLVSAAIEVELLSYGAHLVDVQVPDRQGTMASVVLRRGGLAHYDQPDRAGYIGATVGRFANRLAGPAIDVDGRRYELDLNEGRNQLHGGAIGLDQFVWNLDLDDSLAPTGDSVGEDEAVVVFSTISPAGHGGFPGEVAIELKVSVDSTPSITFDYTATTDRPTVVNLTNHAYWNLRGVGVVGGHQLRVAADDVLIVDPDLIPTGERLPVADTAFDFSSLRALTQLPDGGLDHCYVLSPPTRGGSRGQAELWDPDTGRHMTLFTDQPGLQIYTAGHMDPPGQGICLEAQALPDNPHHAHFPQSLLRPDETYRQTTRHVFDVR